MKHFQAFPFEVKAVEERSGRFTGYASTFGNEDRQGDIVQPGAFKSTLAEHGGRVPILMAHRGDHPIGFGVSAAEDGRGLTVVAELTLESDGGRNAYAMLKHAARLNQPVGLSIGYQIRPGGATFNEKTGVRTLTELDLLEWSIAPTPANPQATVHSVKSLAVGLTSRADLEDFLREHHGLTRAEAKGTVRRIFADDDGGSDSGDDLTAEQVNAALLEEKARQSAMAQYRYSGSGKDFTRPFRRTVSGFGIDYVDWAAYGAEVQRVRQKSWLALSPSELEFRCAIELADEQGKAERAKMLGIDAKDLKPDG